MYKVCVRYGGGEWATYGVYPSVSVANEVGDTILSNMGGMVEVKVRIV